MTFIEMVEKTAENTGKSKKDVKEVLESFFETIKQETLVHGREVSLHGFGKFSKKSTKAGIRTIGGVVRNVQAKDTLKFKSFAKK